MTGKGLFRALEKAPDYIHVLEDMERLTQDRDAQGVLRSALWAQPGRDRVVTWTTDRGGEESFIFRGGIILISNVPLRNLPELRALATRITVMRLDVTDAEMTATIREHASKGYSPDGKLLLESEQCQQVSEFMLSECRSSGCPLDLRMLINSYKDYLLWQSGSSTCNWQDLVAARVREAANHFRCPVSHLTQEERQAGLRNAVREIVRQTEDVEEQLRLYRERTGRSRADFFRKKRQVESGEFNDDPPAGPAPEVSEAEA